MLILFFKNKKSSKNNVQINIMKWCQMKNKNKKHIETWVGMNQTPEWLNFDLTS